jgi:hypothetical protein
MEHLLYKSKSEHIEQGSPQLRVRLRLRCAVVV